MGVDGSGTGRPARARARARARAPPGGPQESTQENAKEKLACNLKPGTGKEDGSGCELALDIAEVLHDVELWGAQWTALRHRLQTAATPSASAPSSRNRAVAQLLDASEAVSDATMSAVRRLSLAGAALLEECESSELAAAAAQPAGQYEADTDGTLQGDQYGWSTSGRVWQLVVKQWDDDRATVMFGMRSGLGLGLGVGVGCAAGWILLLPLHLTILATTVCSLLVGLMLGPMASAAFGRRADRHIGRLCVLAFLYSGGILCWSRVFRPATVESFRDAIIDITTPVQHSGTGQTAGLPRWGCGTATPQLLEHAQPPAQQEKDHQAVCAAFYSCALLELRNAVGSAYAGSAPGVAAQAAWAQRHNRLVDALEYRTVDPVAISLLLLQSNLSSEGSPPWLPPLFSTVNVCGRQFVGVDGSLWWPVPSPPAAGRTGELTRGQRQQELLVNGFAYRKGRVVHHSLLWQRRVLDWLAHLLTARSQELQ
jgi:hypothetical protein